MLQAYWVIFAAAIWVAVLALVPRERIAWLLPLGVVGALFAVAAQLLGVIVFELWSFSAPPLPMAGIPLLLVLAWMGEAILFGHFLPPLSWTLAGYILAFATGITLIETAFVRLEMMDHLRWNSSLTFLVALVGHIVLAAYHLLTGERREVRS